MASASRAARDGAAHYRGELRRLLSGRRFLVFGGPVVGLVGLARQLRSLGAEALVVGASRGTGPVPDRSVEPWVSFSFRARDMMDSMRRAEALYRDPPAHVRRAIERFDPEGRARAAALFTMGDVPSVAGRRRWAGRPRRWLALEDKTRIDRLWRRLELPHAPARVVAARPDALARAARALDRGHGTIWAADASRGVHGGAAATHWVADAAGARRATRALAQVAERVRVMPFLPGVPCSIHGIVLPGHTVVLRPVEMVTLRGCGTNELRYCGFGTFWDPPRAEREAMRSYARRVGEGLRQSVGYRGAFTVDGVLGASGFLPTELNARVGAALGLFLAGVPALPLPWLCLAAIAGARLDWRPKRLEAVLLDAADEHRAGRAMALLRERRKDTTTVPLVRGQRDLRRAKSARKATSVAVLGPAVTGSYLGWFPSRRAVRRGTRLAPHVVRAFAFADRALGTKLGAHEPLPEA